MGQIADGFLVTGLRILSNFRGSLFGVVNCCLNVAWFTLRARDLWLVLEFYDALVERVLLVLNSHFVAPSSHFGDIKLYRASTRPDALLLLHKHALKLSDARQQLLARRFSVLRLPAI